MLNFDRTNTLQQLDGEDWGEPDYSSHLVTEAHRLRRVPLRDFTPENLRIMIGQDIGLQFLIPLAIEVLQDNPWTSGDLYDGDLLKSVLRVVPRFWLDYPDLRRNVQAIVVQARKALDHMTPSDREFAEQTLTEGLRVFESHAAADCLTAGS